MHENPSGTLKSMKLALIALSALLVTPVTIAQASAAQTQTVKGTVVDYLNAVGVNGSAVANNPNSGGITVNSKNAGIYTQGSTTSVQPLGFKANGEVYLLDVSKSHSNLIGKLGNDKGKSVKLKGHSVQENGAMIFVVDSIG